MHVLLIRHAIAEERKDFQQMEQPDTERPLTGKGIKKMQQNIAGLHNMVPYINHVLVSPLVRAQQTADILLEAYPEAQRTTLTALAPLGSNNSVLLYLQQHERSSHTIALVGHEPDLGELGTWLLSGHPDTWLPLKKGSACMLVFENEVAEGLADLQWFLTPAQLRKLA